MFFTGFFGYSQEHTASSENTAISQNAEFPGGDTAFTKEFLKMVHAYTDINSYEVNGQFTFLFDIGTDGKVSHLNVLPKVKNSDMFVNDMQYAISKIKKKWKPALKHGLPISSKKVIKINFTSHHFDHGD